MKELDGRIALVTGASRGIGAVVAERFASAGATVLAAARSVGDEADPQPETVAATVSRIRQRGHAAHAYGLDVAKPASRESAVREILQRFGRVDILINNAGVMGYGWRSWEMPDKIMRKVFEVDVFGPWDLANRVIPGMIERGYGRIVNISSTAADRSAPNPHGPPFLDYHRTIGTSAYCSAKSALNLYTRVLAAELYGTGVSANTVAPVNSVITEATQRALDSGSMPSDRFSAPEDPEVMAEAALALCAADPEKTTGLTTYSGQYLASIGREVRGRDGGPFDASMTVEPVKY